MYDCLCDAYHGQFGAVADAFGAHAHGNYKGVGEHGGIACGSGKEGFEQSVGGIGA